MRYFQLVLFIAAEVFLYRSYIGHTASFHWFTHFYIGATTALLVMAAIIRWRRFVPRYPLAWILVAHLIAMAPDLAFNIAGIAHYPWMDVFLGHISAHFIPGRNLTWYTIFILSLAIYLLARLRYDKSTHEE